MWLGFVICEFCCLIQRDREAAHLDYPNYAIGCTRCGWVLAQYVLH